MSSRKLEKPRENFMQRWAQSSFTNIKGTSLGKKHKRRKGATKINPIQLRNWQQNYIYQSLL